MIILPAAKKRGITVVIGLPDSDLILNLIAQLARLHPLRVIVGGNRFDAHQLARIIRRHTVQLDQTLERIQQARPFTCYQTLKLLAETEPAAPLVVLDLLTTFYDQNISDSESMRLVHLATSHLQRLGRQVPVLVTLRPAAIQSRSALVEIVQAAADQLYIYDVPQETFQPPLFYR